MAIVGWLVDNSAAARVADPAVGAQLAELTGSLYLCAVGELEQLYSARSAADYDRLQVRLHSILELVDPPPDLLPRALALQRDLAHHHGMWHRSSIPDLLIAETALFHGLGILHVDGDYDRIREVRPLTARRLTG